MKAGGVDIILPFAHNIGAMETKTLTAAARTHKGRKTYQLRNEGKVPAVVYGAGIEPKNITVDRNAFTRLYKEAGESTIVELQIDGQAAVNVLIHDIQYDPLRDEVSHADFRAIDMSKPIEAEVKLVFVGESAAVKGLGGTLVHPMDAIQIRALPKDLVSQIEVDISSLVTFEDSIKISDLKLPAGIEALEGATQTVALVAAPRSDEEMAALDKAVEIDVSAVEKVEAKKKDEDAEEGAAEGDAAKAEKKEEKK